MFKINYYSTWFHRWNRFPAECKNRCSEVLMFWSSDETVSLRIFPLDWYGRTECVLNLLEFPSRAFYYLRTHRPYVRTCQSYIPPVQKNLFNPCNHVDKNLCDLCAFAWDKKIISHTESTKFTECLHAHGARVKQIAILCVPCFLCANKYA